MKMNQKMKELLVDVHIGRRPTDPLLLATARKRGLVEQDRHGKHSITLNGKQALEDAIKDGAHQ